ncbi:VOC family protein [Actinophytocola sp.]|uniref:VOC family protein n=1 Tax=Actinophytocola sp. TaxID=1872138 RepID=UPI002ED1E186
MTHGTIAWIQVDTDDPKDAERFYGELFDWAFAQDPDDDTYRLISRVGADGPHGGIRDTRGASPNRAIFLAIVSDVAATVEHAERLGGTVVTPPTKTPNGLVFADLKDPAGNQFGVFTPPAV